MAKKAVPRRQQQGTSAATEKAKLTSDLSSVLSEEKLIDLMDEAQRSGDELGVLRAAHSESFPEEQSNADVLTQYSMKVIPKIRRVLDHTRRETTEHQVGFIIARTLEDGARLFAGRTMLWTSYGQAPAFDSEEAATSAAVYFASAVASREKNEIYDLAVVEATAVVDYALEGNVDVGRFRQIQIRNDYDRAEKIQRLYCGLRAANRQVDGRPIDSAADAIRYLIDQITIPKKS